MLNGDKNWNRSEKSYQTQYKKIILLKQFLTFFEYINLLGVK